MKRRILIRPDWEAVGHQLRCTRRRLGLTRTELAERLQHGEPSKLDYKPSTLKELIARVERGEWITYRDGLVSRLIEARSIEYHRLILSRGPS